MAVLAPLLSASRSVKSCSPPTPWCAPSYSGIPTGSRAAQRLGGQPYTLLEDAVEWIEALAALRRAATDPKIYPFREHVALACKKAAQTLRRGITEPVMPQPCER
ncbi:hypothetical protein OG806_01105 [Streptomyces sp. NBC_00882]|uniref:hypothetical protein n=1 Tax=Streptomyces TaxID=1883 RepID=UPI00386BB30F|nr:hypothetical protein OG806_01105 [Streptomyces sp. NBC_00882]WSZ55176.1 hypothetical protein OH824_00700 [Streptomyces canus]